MTPIAGGVFLRSSNSDSEAKYTLRGDLNYYLGETQKQTLTESTVPTLTSYTLGTNFGAVSVWTVNNVGTYSAYNYYTSAQNSKTLDTTVQVLDVTPLKDLADECNAMLDQRISIPMLHGKYLPMHLKLHRISLVMLQCRQMQSFQQ